MEKQKTREKTQTETKEDLDDLNDMDAMFGNDETEEEAQAKLETIQKLAAASTTSSTAVKEVWTRKNHRRLPGGNCLTRNEHLWNSFGREYAFP